MSSEGDITKEAGGAKRRHGPSGEITRLLRRLEEGDPEASKRLMELAYDEIRDIAAGYHRRERAGHSLQPTDLVHEAFLRLFGGTPPPMRDRQHFFAAFARTVRNVLVDHARRRAAEKRGGDRRRTTLDGLAELSAAEDEIDLLALHEALERLEERSERQAQIVELRFFCGLSVPEITRVLGLGETTVKKEWTMARAWLHAELSPEPP